MPKYDNIKLKRSTPVLLIVKTCNEENTQSLIDCFIDKLLDSFSLFNDNTLDTFLEVALIRYDDKSMYSNEKLQSPDQVYNSLKECLIGETNSTEALMSYVNSVFRRGYLIDKDAICYAPICIMMNIDPPNTTEEGSLIAKLLENNKWWELSKKVLFLFNDEESLLYKCLIHRENAIFHIPISTEQKRIAELCSTLIGAWGYANVLENDYEGYEDYLFYGPEPLSGYIQVLKEISELLEEDSLKTVENLPLENIQEKREDCYDNMFEHIILLLENFVSKDFLSVVDKNCNPKSEEMNSENVVLDSTILDELESLSDSQIISHLYTNDLQSTVMFVLNIGSVILLSKNGIWMLDNNTFMSEGDITIKNVNWSLESTGEKSLEYDYWDIVNELLQHWFVNYQNREKIIVEKGNWIPLEW